MNANIHIFIMAGGSGERFWPASRAATPKHLLRLLGEQTLLEQTIRRFEGFIHWERVYVLTNTAQLEATRAAVPFLPAENIIAEPAKRDTAPAAALATAIANSRQRDAIVGLFPADAIIHNTAAFRSQIRSAVYFADRNDSIFTFAIRPTSAATGFGYLQLGEKVSKNEAEEILVVDRFVEKPNAQRAREFVASGNYGWNAGMFLWKAAAFLRECELQQPVLARFISNFPQNQSIVAVSAYLAEVFPTLPKISVDYAIMENAQNVVASWANFDWDDVGSWTALPAHLGKDDSDNTFKGPVVQIDSSSNIVVSAHRTVALCGVSDIVVVETADAILVCHRDAVENIKKLPIPLELK